MIRNASLLTLALFAFTAGAEAQKFKIDPAHTSVVFRVNHLGFSHTAGMFGVIEGQIVVDDAKPDALKVDLKIKTDSITTVTSAKRDDHLKSPDFFNAKANPWITFKSTGVKATGNSYAVTGDLTMNGVTKSVSFVMKRNRTGEGPDGKVRTGADGQLTIKRSDYNMAFMAGENKIGNDIEIQLSVEAIRE